MAPTFLFKKSQKITASLFVHMIFVHLAKSGIRDWKIQTHILIHLLITQFISGHYFSRLNQRDPECISSFSQRRHKFFKIQPSFQCHRQENSSLKSSAANSQITICRMFLASEELEGKGLQRGNEVNTEIETQCFLKSYFPRNVDSELMFAK